MISKHVINNSYFFVKENSDYFFISYSLDKNDMIKIKRKYDIRTHLNIFHSFLHYIELRRLESNTLRSIQLDIVYDEILLDIEKNILHIKKEYSENKDFYYQEYATDKLITHSQNHLIYFIEDESLLISVFHGENKGEMKFSIHIKDSKRELFSKTIKLNYLITKTENIFMVILLLLIEMENKISYDKLSFNSDSSFILHQKDFLKRNLLEF